jgi:hypothetical protein
LQPNNKKRNIIAGIVFTDAGYDLVLFFIDGTLSKSSVRYNV